MDIINLHTLVEAQRLHSEAVAGAFEHQQKLLDNERLQNARLLVENTDLKEQIASMRRASGAAPAPWDTGFAGSAFMQPTQPAQSQPGARRSQRNSLRLTAERR